jgi:phenylacetic acid degradation operon negative regulatory protein
MRATAEEMLYVLLWTADMLARPTWHNAEQTFEQWARRNGMWRRLADLERQQLVESVPGFSTIVRLTEAGRRVALGGRDPEERWRRSWDGRWRIILFDIPEHKHSWRIKLLRQLRAAGFGYLQNSVWITPDAFEPEQLPKLNSIPDVEVGVVIEGQPCAGESNESLVNGAWRFDSLNADYRAHCEYLRRSPQQSAERVLRDWVLEERARWNAIIRGDPLLPAALLPKGYQGRAAWEQRRDVLARVARRLAPARPAGADGNL